MARIAPPFPWRPPSTVKPQVSNVVLEGIGEGPLRSGAALEAAARALKMQGKIELWNYLGEHKSAGETNAVVHRIWRLNGTMTHALSTRGSF